MKRLLKLAVAVPVIGGATAARATVLYDGGNATNPDPQNQGWLEYTAVGPATDSTGGGETTLDTTGNIGTFAGFSNYNPPVISPPTAAKFVNADFPTLDSTTGFTLSFDLKIDMMPAGGSADRAGFSVILLDSNHTGIELGFWTGDIWAQNVGFTHSTTEDASFATNDKFHHFDLTIKGSSYFLNADGSQILTGSTRDYSSFGAPYNTSPSPYILDNYVFIGDDSTLGWGSEEFSSLSIVPEPTAMVALASSGIGLLVRPRRRRVIMPR